MGRAPALLAAFAVGAYYAFAGSLWDASLWWDIAFLGFVLIPLVFVLVLSVLPLWNAHGLGAVALACAAVALATQVADLDNIANFAKLAAMTFGAFWFLAFFETVSWVVLVACIIPWVDAYSVWRGPTRHIVEHRRNLFTTLSIAFPVPGGAGAANLGLPDLLFFALFLAATERFGLRRLWTWLAMTASFGATMALAIWFEVDGLPALPLLSLAFLLPNADLLWARLSPRARARTAPPIA